MSHRALAAGLAVAAAVLLADPSVAQSPRPRPITGNLKQDAKTLKDTLSGAPATPATPAAVATAETDELSKAMAPLTAVFQKIANLIGDDVEGAVKLSTAIPSLQDGNGQQCFIAMRQFSSIVKAHPLPITGHAITDLEAVRLLTMATNNLCLNDQCNRVFTELAAAVQKVVQQVPGANAVQVPSLSSICTQVVTVAAAKPIVDPGAPPVVTPDTPAAPSAPAAPAVPSTAPAAPLAAPTSPTPNNP